MGNLQYLFEAEKVNSNLGLLFFAFQHSGWDCVCYLIWDINYSSQLKVSSYQIQRSITERQWLITFYVFSSFSCCMRSSLIQRFRFLYPSVRFQFFPSILKRINVAYFSFTFKCLLFTSMCSVVLCCVFMLQREGCNWIRSGLCFFFIRFDFVHSTRLLRFFLKRMCALTCSNVRARVHNPSFT